MCGRSAGFGAWPGPAGAWPGPGGSGGLASAPRSSPAAQPAARPEFAHPSGGSSESPACSDLRGARTSPGSLGRLGSADFGGSFERGRGR